MPLTIRKDRRLPVCCDVTYQRGHAEGRGMVRNVAVSGFQFSGDLPLNIGDSCSLTMTLPNERSVYVTAGVVRWKQGKEYGVETLVMDKDSRQDIEGYLRQHVLTEQRAPAGTQIVTCPNCYSTDCRRCKRRGGRDLVLRLLGRFPWQCHYCKLRFHRWQRS